MEIKKRNITPQEVSFADWYQDVVREANLAEASEVRGCGIVKPYGFKIWELIKKELERYIELEGVDNAYFPLFIPLSYLELEKEHIEGFAPELAVVTHAGGEELENKLVVRPTSETIMYKAYANWIKSYRDLPFRINQWNNVVRWEKRPRAFLRWSEFLWQEGHGAFATEKDAIEDMWKMLDVYENVYKYMAIPVYKGRKSESEKFAGAVTTSTVEAMAKDGKAIQGATSHNLGDNFSKVFNIKYLDKEGKLKNVYQTSWGFAWRAVGAVIMAHGDNNGLVLPPSVAPIQVIIIPITKNNDSKVLDTATKICETLKTKFRVKIDNSDNSLGYKMNEAEVSGIPLRLEIGEKEIDQNKITVFRRDLMSKQEIKLDEMILENIEKLLKEVQESLFEKAKEFSKEHINRIESMDEIKDQIGFFEASWCESKESEKLLKEKYQMVSRVLPKENEDKKPKNSKCFITGVEAKHDWLFAKSY